MSDSFFGFDTKLPPLSADELRRLGGDPGTDDGDDGDDDLTRRLEDYAIRQGEDLEIYDYAAEIGRAEREEEEMMAGAAAGRGELEEERDDLNDETFGGDEDVGELEAWLGR